MEKTYDPHALEQRWYQTWEDNGYFAPQAGNGRQTQGQSPDLSPERPPYCIMIPPPNVTGSLHMGHAFQDTLMDALTRYHRMRGHNTLWQAGTDHAGIATQMVVERQLNAEGKTRHDLGREDFIKKVWEWKAESGGTITRQLRRMGASLDWQHERFTMDDGLSESVKEVFVRLHEEDLIYRGKRLVNWDPVLHTAVSDLEVVSAEETGHMWHFRYPLADGSGHLVVATTRPETMLGDSAVAVNPEDPRYAHLVGKMCENYDKFVNNTFMSKAYARIESAINKLKAGHQLSADEKTIILEDFTEMSTIQEQPYIVAYMARFEEYFKRLNGEYTEPVIVYPKISCSDYQAKIDQMVRLDKERSDAMRALKRPDGVVVDGAEHSRLNQERIDMLWDWKLYIDGAKKAGCTIVTK